MAEEDEELLMMFVQEAGEHLETIEPDLLALDEKGSDTEPETVNRLFRGVHSIKGSAGFFGMTNISGLSHVMENLLGKIRDHSIEPTAEATDALLSGLDRLRAMIGDVANSESVDADREKQTIQAILDAGGAAPAAPPPEPAPETPGAAVEENAAPPVAESAAPPAPAAAAPKPAKKDGSPKKKRAAKAAKAAKAVKTKPKAKAKTASPPAQPAFEARLKYVKPETPPGAPAAAAGGAGVKADQVMVTETLRVSVSVLDELINMAGELVLTRNQVSRASLEVTSKYPHIGPLVQELDSVTSRIQEKVMHARMQPVSVVFNKFPRIIRDLARKLGKKIELNLRGGEVEFDKSVIEHLSDPLTHMIRNVADHAIESPAARVAAGKAEVGQVELAAYHADGMVNISLKDDGAGIDAEKIKSKALKKRLITERQANNMSDEDALELIFAPGFSMAKKVSDVSGRGVGMDVVRTNIEKLRGSVHISSKLGQGTNIVLRLPLTLAIVPAMIVSVGHHRFAVPETGLVEIVRVKDSEVSTQIQLVCNAPVLRLRNALLPLVDLAEVLNVKPKWLEGEEGRSPERRQRWLRRHTESGNIPSVEEGNKSLPAPPVAPVSPVGKTLEERRAERRKLRGRVAYIMVVNVGGNEFGIVVDAVLDSEEIVVKPLPSLFADLSCFSATTILGDGSVALIVDYGGIMTRAKINFSNVEQAAWAARNDKRSIFLRETQNLILLETCRGQRMGILASMVARVEKIAKGRVERISDRAYVRYRDRTFRAVFPCQALGLDFEGSGMAEVESTGDEEEDGFFFMVIPNIPGIQAGLVFSKIIDSIDVYIDLDQRAVQMEGVYGSARINDQIVLLPDLSQVFRMADVYLPPVNSGVDGSGLNALVVDDTPLLRILTASFLDQAGFEVAEARDGEMALGLLKKNRFDLLISDINMPAMTGLELAQETRETPNAEIPMIATSSSITPDLDSRCGRAGFIGCVPVLDQRRLMDMVAALQRV